MIRNAMRTKVLAGAVLALIAGSTQAAVLVDFNSAISALSGTPATVTASSLSPIISSTSPSGVLSRGSGLTAAAATGRFDSSGWKKTLGSTSYYSFTVTPRTNFDLSLSSLVFSLQSDSTTSGPTNWEIRSSADAFASTLFSGTIAADSTAHSFTSTFTGTTFNNLTSATEFRIYGLNTANNSGNAKMSVNALQVNSPGLVALTNNAGASAVGGSSSGSVTTTGSSGHYYDTAIFTAPGGGLDKGFIDITGSLPSPSTDVPVLVMLDLNGTSADISSLLSSLYATTGPGFSVLTAGNPAFDVLSSKYPGTWDAALSFATLPSGTNAGNLDFSWDFTGNNVQVSKIVVVPEPATGMAVLGGGAAAMGLARRRRKS